MASGLVRGAFSVVIEDGTFTSASKRSKTALHEANLLISKTVEDSFSVPFDSFARKLLALLESLVGSCCDTVGSEFAVIRREKLWTAYHQKRTSEIVAIWEELFDAIHQHLDPLVYQAVTQKLFENIIARIAPASSSSSSSSSDKLKFISSDEECIVRYAAGYVPYALIRKYEKHPTQHSVSCIECLCNMAVQGEDSDFLEYTRAWITQVDRGGLFELNDTAYCLFKEIELETRTSLPSHLQRRIITSSNKQSLISSVMKSRSVQKHWFNLCTDMDDTNSATMLLKEIVELWLTIRGNSIAGQWLEIYKNCTAKTTKCKARLRKALKEKQ